VSKMCFSTKSETLKKLSSIIKKAKILPIMQIRVDEFLNNMNSAAMKIQEGFKEDYLIVRSSAVSEDCLSSSNAGRYKSVTNVPRANLYHIIQALNEVVKSYDSTAGTEIFVQPMLTNVKLSGVVFTSDLDTLAPYYIINYDTSGRTDAVTGGSSITAKTYIQYKNSCISCDIPFLSNLINACRELESIFNNPHLDIEFAFTEDGELYILQVRPIVVKNKESLLHLNYDAVIFKIFKKVEKLSYNHPNLLGKKTLFGVMPDWNPAEMIGLRPRQLSLSLYKELLTDSTWAYQRDNYGYRNLRSHPLLISFLGIPFIDVRVDFNSFIPKVLNKRIAEKLVNYYLQKLESMPASHDKIEFEIVYSCYYLGLPGKLKELLNFGFNENELRKVELALLELTHNIIDVRDGLYKKDLQRIETLKKRYDAICNSDLPLIDKIYWLTQDCKRYGTLPFAGIARAAFIAVQLLKSFVCEGYMESEEYERFMNSLNTVVKRLNNALFKLSRGEITKENIMEDFGHLRPGTYDIMSFRYDENFDGYFTPISIDAYKPISYRFSKRQIEEINMALIESGFEIDAHSLIKIIKESIEGREYAKLIFTRSVSKILSLINEMGKKFGISAEELSYIDVRTILNLYSALDDRDVKDTLQQDIERNKELYKYTKALKLPVLIKDSKDIYRFFIDQEEPTFVTLKKVSAEAVKESELLKCSIEKKIVFIRAADPGYDFIFVKDIAGLITQFGGANSHMAIRCAEIGIPAVIGAGEKNFNDWGKAKMLEIDCANKRVLAVL